MDWRRDATRVWIANYEPRTVVGIRETAELNPQTTH